jgi:two-component system, chemotaxis family, protein-glutamate methylesterase/glutaminase
MSNAPPSHLRVVIVEDSPIVRELLTDICQEDASIEVVAHAESGPEGLLAIQRFRPDVILVDLGLPGFDGFELISRIMVELPTPIIVVTATLRPSGRQEAFHALDLGAVHVMEKPSATEWRSKAWRKHFRQELRFLSTASVVRHMKWRPRANEPEPMTSSDRCAQPERGRLLDGDRRPPEIVVVVGSAGGAQASRDALAAMDPLPVPVLVALHLGPNLHEPLARFLAGAIGKHVAIAAEEHALAPGTIHVAPGRRHIELVAKGRVRVFDQLEGAIYAPSLDHLLLSVAKVYGPFACGVILTGLGSDGAAGLLSIRRGSGRTLAQTDATCVVSGMPRAAASLGAVQQSLHPEGIGRVISTWFWSH